MFSRRRNLPAPVVRRVPRHDRGHQRARFCLDMCSVACMSCRVLSWHMAQSASERKAGEGRSHWLHLQLQCGCCQLLSLYWP